MGKSMIAYIAENGQSIVNNKVIFLVVGIS